MNADTPSDCDATGPILKRNQLHLLLVQTDEEFG
jgi:hypothetical protein